MKVVITTNVKELKFRKLWPPASASELEKVRMGTQTLTMWSTRRTFVLQACLSSTCNLSTSAVLDLWAASGHDPALAQLRGLG